MSNRNWFYASEGQQKGPLPEAQLRDLITRGMVGADTLVWTEGMAGWQKAGEIPALVPSAGAPPAFPQAGGPPPVAASASYSGGALAGVFLRFAEDVLDVLLDGKSYIPRPTTTGTHFLSLALEEHNPSKDEYKDVEFGLFDGCFSKPLPLEVAMRLCEKVTEWGRAAYDTRQELKKYA